MPPSTRKREEASASRRHERAPLVILGTAIPALLLALHWFNPEETSIFGFCLLHKVTGLHCPGCGALRAAHALLNARFAKAISCNALLVAALPWLLYEAVVLYLVRQGRRRLPSLLATPKGLLWILAALIVFGALRNLPWPPFIWLAPGPA